MKFEEELVCLFVMNKFVLFWFSSEVGRAGFEPATIRFLQFGLHVRLVGWVTPTLGRYLQRLRQLKLLGLGWLGSSTKLSYRPTEVSKIGASDLCFS